jgi:methionyl-tRNA formyltransferase
MEKSDLRIVFFGTSDFGCPTLDTLLLNQFNVVGVVTKPDFYNPRKKKLEPTPIKEKALQLGLPVLETTDLKSRDFQAQLGAFNGNVFVVIAYQMIPPEVYSMAKYGAFNMHASLLPNYRGAAPINWAIANGEPRIGMTSFFLNEKMDDGDIICQMSVPNYSNRNFTQMYKILSEGVCGGLCCKTLNQIVAENGETSRYKQNPYGYSLLHFKQAPKLTRWNTMLDFSKDVKVVFNHIKAFAEKPGAWCTIVSDDKHNGKALKILGGEVISFGNGFKVKDGCRIILADNNSLLLQCTGGTIKITKLQLEGCKAMTPKDFINGYGNLIINWILQ